MMFVWKIAILLGSMMAAAVQGQITATVPPTTEPLDKCKALAPGTVIIYILNAVNPDQFALFPVDDISAEVGSLYFTDNAWNGTSLAEIEGTIEYKIPPEGITVGEGFVYGVGDSLGQSDPMKRGEWVVVDDSPFALNPTGDTILVYCKTADGEPHFITGINFAGPWSEPGLESYGVNESALPAELNQLGSVVLEGYGNWLWSGFGRATRDEVIAAYSDTNFWKGSVKPFQISPSAVASSSSRHSVAWGAGMFAGLVALLSSFSPSL